MVHVRMYEYIYRNHIYQNGNQPYMFANPARGQLNMDNIFFPVPSIIWSRETSSTVPSRVIPLVLHTQIEYGAGLLSSSLPSPAFHDGTHLCRQPPSSQSRVSRVTHFCTDGVHRRESADTASAAAQAFRAIGTAYSGNLMAPLLCAPLFPYPLLVHRTCQVQAVSAAGSQVTFMIGLTCQQAKIPKTSIALLAVTRAQEGTTTELAAISS